MILDDVQSDCMFCGACYSECTVSAIELQEDENGFLIPKINKDKCIECGKCKEVCPLNNKYYHNIEEGYFFYINSKDILKCTSGGAATSFAQQILSVQGVVYGVEQVLGDSLELRYIRIDKKADIFKIQGTKYEESLCPDYESIKNDLKKGKKVMFIGLPCVCAYVRALNSEIKGDLIIVSLICAGKSTQRLLKKYIGELEEKNNLKVIDFKVRKKKRNWLNSYIYILFENGKIVKKLVHNNVYYWYCHEIKRKSCYNCKFRLDNSPSDIIIGDFWGSEFLPYTKINKKGMSSVICLTLNGENFVKQFYEHKEVYIEKVDLDILTKTNRAVLPVCSTITNFPQYDKLWDNSLNKFWIDDLGVFKIIKIIIRGGIYIIMPYRLLRFMRRLKHRRK